MLCNRLFLIRSYVAAVGAGELPINRARLRDISALVKRLPLLSLSAENDAPDATGAPNPGGMCDYLYRQANDVCLASLLATLTQGLHTLYGCMSKTAQVVDRRPVSLGPRMMEMHPSSGFVRMSHFLGNTSWKRIFTRPSALDFLSQVLPIDWLLLQFWITIVMSFVWASQDKRRLFMLCVEYE